VKVDAEPLTEEINQPDDQDTMLADPVNEILDVFALVAKTGIPSPLRNLCLGDLNLSDLKDGLMKVESEVLNALARKIHLPCVLATLNADDLNDVLTNPASGVLNALVKADKAPKYLIEVLIVSSLMIGRLYYQFRVKP